MYVFYFEKLEVWKNAMQLTKKVYLLTKRFPEEEKYGLISQLRRASSSIGANIAEGVHRNTVKDKARFINQSFGSAMEVLHFLILSKELEIIQNEDYESLRKEVEKIANQLNAFYRSLK